jgi:hypothetical protein
MYTYSNKDIADLIWHILDHHNVERSQELYDKIGYGVAIRFMQLFGREEEIYVYAAGGGERVIKITFPLTYKIQRYKNPIMTPAYVAGYIRGHKSITTVKYTNTSLNPEILFFIDPI